jgi:carboxylesterase
MPPSRWADWAAMAAAAFDELAAREQPIAVLGFSTGAMLALHLSAHHGVARLVLLAPFLAIRYAALFPLPPISYLRHVAKVLPNLPRHGPAVRDPHMRRWAAAAASFRTFSIPAAFSALELIDEVKPLVPRITAPSLIIQGALDTVVEPSGAAWLHQHLGSAEKSLITLPRSDHLVALDREREQVISLAKTFVLGHSAGGASGLPGHLTDLAPAL